MKSLQQTPEIQCSVRETKDSYIVRIEQERFVPKRKVGLFIPWGMIAFISFAGLLALAFWCLSHNASVSQQNDYTASTEELLASEETDADAILSVSEAVSAQKSAWVRTGFLFPDSDVRYLNEDDIASLSWVEGYTEAKLLRYAINEIYARHHYLFDTEEYLLFFGEYDWYDGYLNAEDASAAFNSIEHKNIAFLLSVEENYKE